MNPVDILILVLMGLFVIKGALRGVLKEICSLMGLFVGVYLAFVLHTPLAQWLLDGFDLPAQLAVGAACVALFLGSVLVFGLLGFVLSRFVAAVHLGGINRMIGGMFGLVQGVVLLALVLFALGSMPLPQSLIIALRDSQLSPPFVTLGGTLIRQGQKTLGR